LAAQSASLADIPAPEIERSNIESASMNPVLPAWAATAGLPVLVQSVGQVGRAIKTGFAALLGEESPEVIGAQRSNHGQTPQALSAALTAFGTRLKELLESAGINTSYPVRIGWDNVQQRLAVRSHHPQWEELQELVSQDKTLTELFVSLTSIVQGSHTATYPGGDRLRTFLELQWTADGVVIQP